MGGMGGGGGMQPGAPMGGMGGMGPMGGIAPILGMGGGMGQPMGGMGSVPMGGGMGGGEAAAVPDAPPPEQDVCCTPADEMLANMGLGPPPDGASCRPPAPPPPLASLAPPPGETSLRVAALAPRCRTLPLCARNQRPRGRGPVPTSAESSAARPFDSTRVVHCRHGCTRSGRACLRDLGADDERPRRCRSLCRRVGSRGRALPRERSPEICRDRPEV